MILWTDGWKKGEDWRKWCVDLAGQGRAMLSFFFIPCLMMRELVASVAVVLTGQLLSPNTQTSSSCKIREQRPNACTMSITPDRPKDRRAQSLTVRSTDMRTISLWPHAVRLNQCFRGEAASAGFQDPQPLTAHLNGGGCFVFFPADSAEKETLVSK